MTKTTERNARRPRRDGRLTRPELARALRVDARTITRWERFGCPSIREGRGKPSLFVLSDVRAWSRAFRAAERQAAKPLEKARARLVQIRRELLDLELALKRGDLVNRDQVIRDGQAHVKTWRSMLLALPKRARQAGAIREDQVRALKALVCDTLTAISRWRTVEDCERAARRAS